MPGKPHQQPDSKSPPCHGKIMQFEHIESIIESIESIKQRKDVTFNSFNGFNVDNDSFFFCQGNR